VSVAYPISIGATLGFVALGAVVFLNEKITFLQIVGMLFLLAGVFLISWNYKGALTP
jgi:multidrug transporter EmrE-like cation transporter